MERVDSVLVVDIKLKANLNLLEETESRCLKSS